MRTVEKNKQDVCLMPVGVFLVAHIRTEQNQGMKHAVRGDTVAVSQTTVETGIHDNLSDEATPAFLEKQKPSNC